MKWFYLLLFFIFLFITWYPIKSNRDFYCTFCKLKTTHDTTDYPDERIVTCTKCGTRTVTKYKGKEVIDTKITRPDRTPDDKSGRLGRPPKETNDD